LKERTMKAAEWIDRVKRERGWDSDYRVAKELGVTKAAVSNYRTSPNTTLREDVAVRVAEALGEEAEIIIIDQALERARSEPARAVLTRILDKISKGGGGAAAVALTACLALGGLGPRQVEAKALDITFVAHDIHRMKRWLLQLVRALRDALAPPAPLALA
jgi:predicted transcriptional regulator